MNINREQAEEIIRDSEGQILTVKFRKRGDGTIRTLTGRRAVRKGVKGVGLPYDPKAHSLLTIYEMLPNEGGGRFRTIPIEGITQITSNGKQYFVQSGRVRFR